MAKKDIEEKVKHVAGIINRFRYYCFACTGRVMFSPEPFEFTYQVCGTCGKVHDGSNYKEENWLPMSVEEIAGQ